MKMVKRCLSVLLALAMCTSLSTSMFAATGEAEDATDSQKLDAATEEMVQHAKEQIDLKIQQRKNNQSKDNQEKVITMMAVNPPLSEVYIDSITSELFEKNFPRSTAEKFNWNVVGKATRYDHGGLTRIVTYEIGFADSSSREALFNGGRYPQLIGDVNYDSDHDGWVDGMIQTWEIDDVDSGTFKYIATSSVSPYLERNDWLIIK